MSDDEHSEARTHKAGGRFPKGVSGNPRGRPRKREANIKVNGILSRKVSIKLGDETIRADPRVAVWLSLLARGLKGSASATDAFLNLSKKLRANLPYSNRIKKIIRISVRPGSCDGSLSSLGLIKEVDGAFYLEPWVVKEALKRNPSCDLSGLDRSELLRPLDDKVAAEKLLAPYGLKQCSSEDNQEVGHGIGRRYR